MLLLSVLLRLTNGFLTDSGAPAGAPVIFGPAAYASFSRLLEKRGAAESYYARAMHGKRSRPGADLYGGPRSGTRKQERLYPVCVSRITVRP